MASKKEKQNRSGGIWVMLTAKLPVKPSPPKMSIFWSLPWSEERFASYQRKAITAGVLEDLGGDHYYGGAWPWGVEPKWSEARKILFEGEAIRIFPHEFSVVEPERMKIYIAESHDLIPSTVADEEFATLKGERLIIYEQALTDGCDDGQARLMAMGIDVSEGHYEIPAIGWYKIRQEYGLVFCTEDELLAT